MNEDFGASCQERQRTRSVAAPVSFGLTLSAVIVGCCISFLLTLKIPIERPVMLVLASLFLLLPLKAATFATLQKIVAFYLISVPVNELSSQYFQISFLPVDVSVSYTTAVLLLCALGYLVGKINTTNATQDYSSANILSGWVVALVIVTIHMALLSLILNKFYGYGYERNLGVLGNLFLYFLLFVLMWENLGGLRFRQCTGLVLAVFYFATLFVNK
ncbi:MAG TPA: hypothetical protein VMW16_10675 [Sedimentisphaerales bacterium]|nr:hypothetical protein [Sedimentisphaerales bacterium]